MSKELENLINKKFNRFTIISFSYMKNGQSYWNVKCDCGNMRIVQAGNLKTGNSKSCGCWRRDYQKEKRTTHGLSNSRLYYIYISMKQRCLNPNHPAYKDYGGRGIKVCDRWLDEDGFIHFFEDMGPEYERRIANGEKISLDRWPDVNGNYEPGNVRWALSKEQNQNMRTSSKSIDIKQHIFWRHKLLSTVNRCIHKEGKSLTFFLYVGIFPVEFKKYIESLWTDGMTWNNYGKGKGKWQLDHIIGCNNFDLSKEEDRFICFNYKNYQPLWDKDHKMKSKQRKR